MNDIFEPQLPSAVKLTKSEVQLYKILRDASSESLYAQYSILGEHHEDTIVLDFAFPFKKIGFDISGKQWYKVFPRHFPRVPDGWVVHNIPEDQVNSDATVKMIHRLLQDTIK
jgi:hypothetical protein